MTNTVQQATLIWRRRIADTETAVSAALKLMEPGRGDFLLESVEGGEQRGRHSLIGLAPDLVFRAKGQSAEINRSWDVDRDAFEELSGDPLTELRALAQQCRADVPPELPSALACLVGYFGYETVTLVEPIQRAPASPLALPDMVFVRPTVILVFDRLADELFLVTPIWHKSAAAEVRAAERLDAIERLLDGPLAVSKADVSATKALADGTPTPVLTDGQYGKMVARAKDYIEAGDIFQVVLAQRFTMDFPLPPIDLYRALRRINPSPFLYFLDLPDFAIIGSSPEILVRVRDGEVTIRPIAGTRPTRKIGGGGCR